MSTLPDRLESLLAQTAVTGIDFVYVYPSQTELDVFFLKEPTELTTPLLAGSPPVPNLTADKVRIYRDDGGPDIKVTTISGVFTKGRVALHVMTDCRGDFTQYRLRIDDSRVDPYFNDAPFSFKANCPSELDCRRRRHECPDEKLTDFPVDYQARDFWSYRRALLDFAAQRYPDWKERLEADAGVMLLEAMSALADELAYYQDRVGREAYFETADQRRSLRRHAQLVDYPIHDGLGGSTLLAVEVSAGAGSIPAGTDVWAVSDAGEKVCFEVGHGIAQANLDPPGGYGVRAANNRLLPHVWDDSATCLAVGAIAVDVDGSHEADLPPGKWVVLRTNPRDPGMPQRVQAVRLVKAEDMQDPVLNPHPVTRLTWESEQALPFEMDIETLEVLANIVPVTAGKEHEGFFVVGCDPSALVPAPPSAAKLSRAVERQGATRIAPAASSTPVPASQWPEAPGSAPVVTYLFSLSGSDEQGLVWLGADARSARPEVVLDQGHFNGSTWATDRSWMWRRSFVGTDSSEPADLHFTLDDGMWRRVVGYQRRGQETVHIDYASGAGRTVRFGDGEFGLVPAEKTIFRVRYRLGNGRQGNVPTGAISQYVIPGGLVTKVFNPLPVQNGTDAETPEEIRQLAPEAFQNVTYRAVRPEDYAKAAEQLAWVARAGARFRWTGSWMTAFATPDPTGTTSVSAGHRAELEDQLDRYRQAGRETHVLDPVYANLDLELRICVAPECYPGDVLERVMDALVGKRSVHTCPCFFSPDNFTFGTPLRRSELEAAIQAVPGVRAVMETRIRRRGWFDWRTLDEFDFEVGVDEVIRVENDPRYPERGSLKIVTEGGA